MNELKLVISKFAPFKLPKVVTIWGANDVSFDIKISDVSAESLSDLCNQFRASVFEAAGKVDPLLVKDSGPVKCERDTSPVKCELVITPEENAAYSQGFDDFMYRNSTRNPFDKSDELYKWYYAGSYDAAHQIERFDFTDEQMRLRVSEL